MSLPAASRKNDKNIKAGIKVVKRNASTGKVSSTGVFKCSRIREDTYRRANINNNR